MSSCHEGYDRACGNDCAYPACHVGARHLSGPPDILPRIEANKLKEKSE